MLMQHDEGRLMTVREAAAYLGLSPLTVYRRLARGEISYLRLGASEKSPIRIRAGALEAFLRSNVRAAGDDPADALRTGGAQPASPSSSTRAA